MQARRCAGRAGRQAGRQVAQHRGPCQAATGVGPRAVRRAGGWWDGNDDLRGWAGNGALRVSSCVAVHGIARGTICVWFSTQQCTAWCVSCRLARHLPLPAATSCWAGSRWPMAMPRSLRWAPIPAALAAADAGRAMTSVGPAWLPLTLRLADHNRAAASSCLPSLHIAE